MTHSDYNGVSDNVLTAVSVIKTGVRNRDL